MNTLAVLLSDAFADPVDADLAVYSDVFKEAYGYRPRGSYEWFAALSQEERSAEIARLSQVAQEEVDRERAQQEANAKEVEACITLIMSTVQGATREDAIRYLHDAHDTQGDVSYLEFCLWVPYGYFSGKNLG